MRTTNSIQFYCRKSKENKNGESPLEMSICLNGERKFINLPIKFKPEEFNRKRQPQTIQESLAIWRNKINSIINELMLNNIPLTATNIRTTIQTGGVKSYTVQNLFDDYLNILRKRIDKDLSSGVYRKYELVKEQFLNYVNPNAEVTTITNNIIQNYYADLKQKYDDSTTAGYMRKLKTFIKFGMDNDKIKINPFQNIKITRPQKDIDFLTENEINKLASTSTGNTSLDKVKDCFIVMCGTGMAYSDIKQFHKDDLQSDHGTYYINKKREKTGVEYTSVVLPFAASVINKYDGRLPVISNQKFNAYLHTIEVILNIKKKLHTHLARHSYATLLLNKGVKLETVSKTLCHSSTKMTTTYYAKYLPQTIVAEVAKAF